jgi:thymidine kinase
MASLYFKYAAMNSGKSTQLLQAHYNYFERGMNPVAMTAKLDDRHGSGKNHRPYWPRSSCRNLR